MRKHKKVKEKCRSISPNNIIRSVTISGHNKEGTERKGRICLKANGKHNTCNRVLSFSSQAGLTLERNYDHGHMSGENKVVITQKPEITNL